MDPITMMVASIGMQFFNNYANSKKNKEIQEKQREFQKAAAKHDFDRMRQLQAESAKLALELEAEVHKERVEDINNSYDALLDNFAHSFAIQNWPLNVLPFIMKGESFGTLFNGTTQSVNMHCILTPSNCEWFNKNFYDDIDLRLEAEMNNKWNAQTTHPIIYYGGAWNRRSMNKGVSVPNVVDLDDIELLKIKLKDVPVVVITPYFDPWLHFKVKLWGMGKNLEAPYRIDIPHGNEVEYSQRIFSYDYHKDQTELTEDFENTTIEEFVPYLESLIGFVADKYFWSMYGISPSLPSLIKTRQIPLGLKNSLNSGYHVLMNRAISIDDSIESGMSISKESILMLYKGIKPFLSREEQIKYTNKILSATALLVGVESYSDSQGLSRYLSLKDLPFIKGLTEEVCDSILKDRLSSICESLQSQITCSIIEMENLTFVDILDFTKELIDSDCKHNIKIEINDNFVLIGLIDNDDALVNNEDSPKVIIVQYKKLIIADRLQIRSKSFILERNTIEKLYQQVKKLY